MSSFVISLWTIARLLACSAPTLDADTARWWAERHAITLDAVALPTHRLLVALPSRPGDPFTCSTFTLPPEIAEEARERLAAELCRQQQAVWHADRREAEEKMGTELLTGAFLHYGVVGVELSIGSPEGIEWSDRRGVLRFANAEAVPATGSGITGERGAALGYGLVDLQIAPDGPPQLHPALEWRYVARVREAIADVRLFVQTDGHPDAEFVRHAMSR